MTQPPPSGPWGAQPPQQPGNWQGYPGGQPGPQGQWNPQQQWPNTMPPPQKKGPVKWILGAIALIAVIAVTAVVAVSCAGGKGTNNGGGGTSTSGSKSDIASANDTGPVSVITEDPSCAPWGPINDTLANIEKNGWDKRDPSLPATSWTPDIRDQHQAVARAMENAANQSIPLIKLTTHRVMRELFEQFRVYARAYAAKIESYTPDDNNIALTVNSIGATILGVCQSISFGSAAARSPLIAAAEPPARTTTVGDPASPQRFMKSGDPICEPWISALNNFNTDPAISAWFKTDPNIPASSWTPDLRAVNEAIVSPMKEFTNSISQLGANSQNPSIQDFATLAVQYGSSFIEALPTYTQPDEHLYDVLRYAPGIISGACKAGGGN